MAERKSTKISLKPIDALLGTNEKENVIDVPLTKLHGFKDHPFRVIDDEDMYHLAESIRENGILNPAIVREDGKDGYEILSGHRRKRACELCGMEKMPVVVKDMDDDSAIIFMTDSNIQRTSLLVSERAFSSKMRYEAMKRQGKRTDMGDDDKGDSIDKLAKDYDCSPASLRRLFRMTELIPSLLNLVDDKRLAFNSAVEISYLTTDEQEMVLSFMKSDEVSPSLAQARELRSLSKTGEITDEKVMEILLKEELTPINVRLKSAVLKRFFPAEYTSSQIEDVIIKLLTEWAGSRMVS